MAKKQRDEHLEVETPVANGASPDAPEQETAPKRARTRTTRSVKDEAATPETPSSETPSPETPSSETPSSEAAPSEAAPSEAASEEPAPKRRRARSRRTEPESVASSDAEAAPSEETSPEAAPSEAASEEPAPKRRRARSRRTEPEPVASSDAETAPSEETSPEAAPSEAPSGEPAPKRRRARSRRTEPKPVASSDAEAAPSEEPSPEEQAETPAEADPVVPEASRDEAAEASAAEASAEAPPAPATSSQQAPPANGQASGKRKRGRKKNKQGGQQHGHHANGGGHPGKAFVGMVEMIGDKNFGFIRAIHPSLPKGDNDAFMPPPLIDKYHIRDGVIIEGIIKPGRKGAWQVTEVHKIMGVDPEEWKTFRPFDEGVTIYPNEKLNLVTGPADISMRVVDLVAPLGKGQRALIVAPPRAGKTVLLKQMARSIAQNHPEVELVALLIDERPEEVTDFRRNTEAMVFASSNDYQEDNHIRVATLGFEYCRRLVEMGKDVVLLLDSLTRLGRTFNLWGGGSGRTMSGGLDARALVMPRKIFGAARNIEHGGSLTIIATALVETGSRMDEVIFEEFKGTGNAEIVLDRELADKRIFPAINLRKSGTRNVEQLLGFEMMHYHNLLMRALNSRHPVEAMQALLRHIMATPDNVHLMNELIPSEI